MANLYMFSDSTKRTELMRPTTLRGILMACFIFLVQFISIAQEYVPFTPRLDGGNIEVRGDIIFVGNNILNRASESNPSEANTPYNGTANNNSLWMEYIDIDSDSATFSSSSAELNLVDPDCSQVRYAGLYWAGTYPNERSTDGGAQFNGTPRIEEWNEIKFRVPGGAYVDLVADNNPDPLGQEDDIILDGYQPGNPGVFVKDGPVICYKNITDLVRSNPNPNGAYTAANIRATRGRRNGSSSAGWVMVIIYENPNESGKFISTFDGYASLSGAVGNVDVSVNGFRTLPAPFSVNAKIGVGSLEGDRGIRNDRFFIEANSSGSGFTNLSTGLNPANNFFNSTITTNGAEVPTRLPYGTNTLGTDLDIFNLDNQFNNILPNDETGATLRFTSSGDGYGPFLTVFSVEIIEPNIVLEKRVNTPGGVDITGLGVNLGQVLDYVLSFENIGNDDAANYTIRDILPVNVSPPDGRTDFIASDFVLPPGVTYTYTAASREVIFTIPNDLVQEGDPVYSIRMRVKVAENCFDFIDACSDLIQNLAYSTYSGVENSAIITDDPSVTDFNACGFVIPGATNFLLDDLSDCNFERTVELCGNFAILDAGDGFDEYIWVRDDNGNNLFDATDTVITDGDPDNDPSTIIVAQIGTYIVDKIVADPCKGFKEIITVEQYGSGLIPNPIIEYYNQVNGDTDPFNDIAGEIVQCSVDNDLLPKLFLCGIDDTKLLQVNILDAQSIVWERLDEGSCDPSGDDCANKALTCTWSQVATGNNYTVNNEGQYRLSVTYQNGCTSRFYFNVFQNTLDILYNKEDIICSDPGNITITNLGNGYGYQLVDAATNTILTSFAANNGPSFDFASGENGSYIVEVTQLDNTGTPIADACIFRTPEIGILDRAVSYAVTPEDATCSGLGSINVQINNADPNYEYELRLDDGSNGGQGTLIDNETAQPDNNFTFTDLNAGNYIVIARTDDGCEHTEQVSIVNNNDLEITARVSQHITCREGNILVDSGGGKTPHTYAIWSFVDNSGTTVTSYPTPQDIPSSEFQSSQIFDIMDAGNYVFLVVDRNNCFSFSNEVTIEFRPAADFDPTSVIDVACFGDSSGTIQFNLLDDNGFQLTFFLYDENGVELATNTSGYFPNLPTGDYEIVINQRKGSASCDYTEQHTISGPANAIAATSVLIQDFTCIQNGIIEVQNVTGGTAPYSFSIDGVNFVPDTTPNANRFENLTDGTYTPQVRDAAGCVFPTDPIIIAPLLEPTDLTFVAATPNCPSLVSDVTVSVVDGNPNFTYEIIAPAGDVINNGTSNTFADLAPGTYTFSVTDTKGCTIQEDFTIIPVDRISVIGQLDSNVTCLGASDGAVTFTISDFVTSFDYSVSGPSTFSGTAETANTIPLTGLPAGTYTITVTDNNTNCTDTTDVTVAAPPAVLSIATLDVIDLTCSTTGTVPGSVTITASGGWGGFEYELADPSGAVTGPQGNNTFTGLTDTSGNYTITVRDAGGCEITNTFSLTPTVAPVLEVIANSLCYDSATGLVLTANVTSGGVAPFQYRLNGGAYQSNTNFTGLAPGSYTVEVIDSKNCTGIATIDVFPTMTANAALIKDLDCSVPPDAEISLNITGGNPSFTYEVFLDGTLYQASSAVPSIPFSYFTTTAGTYTFTITDSQACMITTNEVVVTDNVPPTSTPIITAVLCNGDANGVVNLNVSGGIPPYAITFNGSAASTQQTYSGLSTGTYNYTVTDSKGCIFNGTALVSEPDAIVLATNITTDYTCTSGAATVTVTSTVGGVGPYLYSIDGVNFSGTSTFTGLTEGSHTITVRDANQCTTTSVETIAPLNPPTDLAFTQTAPTCPAIESDVTVAVTGGNSLFTYEIVAPASSIANNGNNATFAGLSPGTYTFRVTDDKNCVIEEDYTINPIPEIGVLHQLVRNVTCFGDTDGEFTFTASDFVNTFSYTVVDSGGNVVQSNNNINTTTAIAVSGLLADSYTVNVVDDTTNCDISITALIEGPLAALDFTFTNTPVTCAENATITLSAAGGWANYTYQLENTVGPAIVYPYQPSNTFSDVPVGSYTIYVRDGNGCIVDKPITIDPAETPAITLAASDFCFDDTDQASLTVDVANGVAPYSYSINGGGQNTFTGTSVTIPNLIPGTYDIQITDAFGCVSNVLTQTIAPSLTANAVVTKALDCTVSPDANIDVNINNGYLPYASYEVSTDAGISWSPATPIVGTTFSYSAATAGIYDFRITDARGCTVITSAEVVPIVSPVITSLVQTTDILCNGDAGASIQVNLDITQGVAPFVITVFNITTATNYSTQTAGLPAGTYEVTVTDSKSCTDMETIVISEPDPLSFETVLTDITCDSAGSDPTNNTIPGSITVFNTAGGTAEYTYYLTANNGMPTQTYTTTPGNLDHTFNILNFGIYNVQVVDANGCSLNSDEIIASPPDDLDIDVSAITADCVAGGEAVVTVSSAFSSGTYEFAILETYSPPFSVNYQNADVVGGDSATFSGLIPGITYTFVVYDLATKCYYFETADAPINSPSGLTSTLDVVANVSCTGSADGNVSFTFDNYASDATDVTYEIFNFQSNTTTGISGTSSVNPPAVGTGVSVPNLGPLPQGVYYILFNEVNGTFNGCSVASDVFTIEEAAVQLVATATLEKNDNCNPNAGQISAIGQFGRAPYEYQLALSTDVAPTVAIWTGNSTNFFNVEGGSYTVYVKDAFGCIQSDDVVVPVDPSPEISVLVNDQCTANEGSFSAVITLDVAGIVPHVIRIDGGAPIAASGLVNSGDTMTISNLSSGTHTFEIIDQNGCGEIESITIYPPLTALVAISSDENCDPANTGEVTVTASGGSGTYTYTLITPAGPNNGTGIFGGLTHSVSYTFEVEDTVTNCTVPVTITLPVPSLPTFSLSNTDVSCFGGNDGSITVTLAPGNIDIPYLYSLDGGATTQTSNVFSGLSQGTYNVTVISDKGCEDTRAIDVNEPSALSIAASASAFSCDDTASTITVTINNDGFGNPSGTGPYLYSFDNGANFGPNNTFQVAFGAPDVTIVVQDSNGCADSVIVSIPLRDEVTALINVAQVIDCVNGEERIAITASNGSGNYTYTALPSGIVVPDPTNIVITAPGNYVYEITDTTTNCSVTVEHNVAPYDLLDVTAAPTTDATCSDSTNGTIEVTVSGYIGTFDYQVLDASGVVIAGTQASDNATIDPYVFTVSTTFGAGTYSVEINQTAFPQCADISNTVTIDAPEPLALQLIDNVNANCNEANAIVTVLATGGTPLYTYGASISGAGIPATFAFDNTIELDPTVSLAWDIYVQDSNGCIIGLPLPITIATDTTPDVSLNVADVCAAEGSFEIIVTLDAINTGVAPYTMRITGGTFQSIASFPYTYSGLNAGTYDIEIRDANGCSEIESITIASELRINTVVNAQPSCNTDDGIIEFTVNGGSGAFTVALLRPDFSPLGIAPTGNQFIGVGFGDYIVRVTDTSLGTPNCFADAFVTLEEPTPVTLLNTDKTDVSCAGASDGSISVNLETPSAGVNDNPPYVFVITDGTNTFTQNNGLFTGLPAGTYDITVTSNRNCVATDQVIIGEPIALDASITAVTEFVCDVNNVTQVATIEVTITTGTGTPDYFYSVNGSGFLPTNGTVFTYSTTVAGTYDIIVRDANGCLFPLPTQTIDPINTFTAQVTQNAAITCTNPEEVLITITDDGNPHNYIFELLPVGNPNGVQTATTATTATYSLSAVGSYTFRITDTDTGCYIDTLPYDIAPFDFIDVVATATTPVTCFGDGNGALEINITGYTGTYSYQVFDAAGNTVGGLVNTDTSVNPRPIGGLSGGNYSVRITETAIPFCTDDSNTVTIVSPDSPLTVIVDAIGDPTCDNDQGEILVDPSGGYAPYDISMVNTITGDTYTATDVQAISFAGLSAGNFDITVTDASGCVYTDTEVLNPATPITANATPLITDLACYGDTGATVSANVTGGGSGSYEYQLNYYDAVGTTITFTTGQQLSPNFNDLGAGIYSITVSDGWNCDIITNTVEITEPTLVEALLIRTDPLTCATGVEFELSASGGSGTYEYSTDNVTFLPMTSNPLGLPETGTFSAGTYQYYVRDAANGCDAVLSNAVTEDTIIPLTLTVDDTAAFINCTGESTAVIYAEANGGLGNYQYELFTDAALTLASRIAGPQTVGEFRNLPAGTYYVSVTSEDCVTTPEEVIILAPIPLSYTEDIVNISCAGEDNGSITVTLSGGAGGYQYAISPNLNQFDTINTFTDLSPGDYTVIAQDQNGCFEYLEYTITAPTMLSVSAVATPEICADSEDGTITLAITGGTAPYSTALNSNDDSDFVLDRTDFTNMAAGNYLIFVRDANGCDINVVVDVEVGVNLNAAVVPVYECTGNMPSNYVNITLEDPSLLGDVMYALDSTDPSAMQLNPDFRNTSPGVHYIAIAHTNGCVQTVEFTIEAFEPLTLVLEQRRLNEITAIAEGGRPEYTYYFNDVNNGNDNTFYITRTDTYEVRVVDENGCESIASIFIEFIDIEIPNFFTPDGDGNNDFWIPRNIEQFPEILIKIFDRYGRVVSEQTHDAQGWDGKYNKKELPTGDYWYVIQLNGEEDEREFVGHFTLYR